ncbi:hypothetical protein J0H58_22050 [bacterium]|nr:hypothetical protein [bacterium]
MPLRDHFHPPLLDDPPWPSLATMWVAALTAELNATLARGEFTAAALVRSGWKVEREVRRPDPGALPPRFRQLPIVYPDVYEVQVAEAVRVRSSGVGAAGRSGE